MAGGPQDGQRFRRDFYAPRATPPAMRASDGKVCCPVAVRNLDEASLCVVVHPQARDEEIERAIDGMVAAAAAQGRRNSGN
ncbi:hypothetical protein [Luteibacter yeojuensis]|uniref:Uncharacterized protein n=1 Tax=Luteibacter yeojuensis TaxID=345309 RepID=A0A0F3KN07_9GAMM|nr:hypothetical protein [Luteibacter yeojuensis]KJV32546.1 hypothetical protein VI08_12510 [Luteibacter yeojuensis]